MSDVQNQEFREQQEVVKYPFTDTSTLLTATGLTLPADMFLDASLYPAGFVNRPRLSQVVVVNRRVTLHLGDATQTSLASCSFDPFDPPESLFFVDEFDRPAGVLVSDVERIAGFQAWTQGVHTFAVDAAEFVASCTIPLPEVGLRGIKVGDTILSGDVWLIGEDGVVVREIDGVVRLDLVGDPLFKRRSCDEEGQFEPRTFIRKINDMPPDANGMFGFVVVDDTTNTILRIYPAAKDQLNIELIGKPPGAQ